VVGGSRTPRAARAGQRHATDGRTALAALLAHLSAPGTDVIGAGEPRCRASRSPQRAHRVRLTIFAIDRRSYVHRTTGCRTISVTPTGGSPCGCCVSRRGPGGAARRRWSYVHPARPLIYAGPGRHTRVRRARPPGWRRGHDAYLGRHGLHCGHAPRECRRPMTRGPGDQVYRAERHHWLAPWPGWCRSDERTARCRSRRTGGTSGPVPRRRPASGAAQPAAGTGCHGQRDELPRLTPRERTAPTTGTPLPLRRIAECRGRRGSPSRTACGCRATRSTWPGGAGRAGRVHPPDGPVAEASRMLRAWTVRVRPTRPPRLYRCGCPPHLRLPLLARAHRAGRAERWSPRCSGYCRRAGPRRTSAPTWPYSTRCSPRRGPTPRPGRRADQFDGPALARPGRCSAATRTGALGGADQAARHPLPTGCGTWTRLPRGGAPARRHLLARSTTAFRQHAGDFPHRHRRRMDNSRAMNSPESPGAPSPH